MSAIKKLFLNEFVILGLIIGNALLIFVQEFEIRGNILDYFEPIFTILFVIEMLIKISDKGFKGYISNSWNKLDFTLVLISIPSLAAVFYSSDILELNIFLTLRVFRVFKFFRFIKFLPNINALVSSIQSAIKASYIVIIGFFILIFIVSLITCSIYKNIVPEYFSNPTNSFYSIFRLFSVEGWYEIPDLIATRTSPLVSFLSKIYFGFLLLSGGILGLSLVNSIFVDAMVSDNNNELQNDVNGLTTKIDSLNDKIETLIKTQNNNFKN